jgi:hypothetical protein
VSVIGAASAVKLGAYDFKEGLQHFRHRRRSGDSKLCRQRLAAGRQAFAHLHMIVGEGDGRTRGGHVFEGCCVIVAEYQIFEFEGAAAERTLDPPPVELWKAEKI